jgi:GWxTD domain-containing protein
MKKLIYTFLLAMMAASLSSQNMNANLEYLRFFSPEFGPYVETYLTVNMRGLQLEEIEKGKFLSKVNLLLIFRNKDSIVSFSKTQIHSPIIEDTTNLNFNFIDQQRFFLPNGKYFLDIEFGDAIRNKEPFKTTGNFELEFESEKIQFSDFEFLDSYEPSDGIKVNTKNGYDMVPYVGNFFGTRDSILNYYAEFYNADKILGAGEDLLLMAYISSADNDEVNNNYVVRKKVKAEEVNVVLSSFKLTNLPSGNYYLVIELINRENEHIVAQKKFFQLSNKNINYSKSIIDEIASGGTFVNQFSNDSITQLINSLFPIADANERSFLKYQLPEVNLEEKQKFFYYFWQKVDPYAPENAWRTYHAEVLKTNRSFGNKYTPGYATDMGRVYLQYGPPNTISDQEYESGGGRHEGSVPYQIWHYYEIGNQRDGKFVFYNPHLIPRGYELLHSNVIGEISNAHWQTYLRRNQLESIDTPENDTYGGRSGELYNNPR